MEDETIELARQLLSRLTDRDGWNEGRMGELVNLLADLIDPTDTHSIAALRTDSRKV